MVQFRNDYLRILLHTKEQTMLKDGRQWQKYFVVKGRFSDKAMILSIL